MHRKFNFMQHEQSAAWFVRKGKKLQTMEIISNRKQWIVAALPAHF
jgi:hypothetical protein